MSSITKLGSGKYRARYRNDAGQSRSKTFSHKRDAEAFLATQAVRILDGSYVDQSAGRETFKDYAERWRTNQPHRPATAASTEHLLRVHIYPTLGHLPLRSIRTSTVQAWIAGLDLAPTTVVNAYGKVRAIFRAAVDDRLISSSPCTRSIKLPRQDGAEVVPMSPEQVRAVLDATPARYKAFIILLAGSGLRPAEALGLTVNRVDWLRRTVRVDRQLVTIANHSPTLAPCKTPSSVRTVAVPQAVIDALAAHLDTYGSGPDDLIFTDGKGDPIRRNAIGHVWRRAAAAAAVTDYTPHDLRHYAASVLIEQGASVKAVQKHLGHASATTTLDTYAHLWPDAEETTRRALDVGLAAIVSPLCHEEPEASTI